MTSTLKFGDDKWREELFALVKDEGTLHKAKRASGGMIETYPHVSRIKIVDHSTVELQKSNANDDDVAYAAWVSNFGSEARNRNTDRIGKLIDFLYSNLHMSPFEHGSFTWFVDTTIETAREFMRHRTWSYNETSGRYKDLEPRFYIPNPNRPLVQVGKVGAYAFTAGDTLMYDNMKRDQLEVFELAWAKYQKQLKDGVAREVARGVLPLHLMTQFYGTSNPRNVMQFLTLRTEAQAKHEIREVARVMEEDFASFMPLTYAAFNRQRETWQKINRLLDLMSLEEIVDLVEGKTE